MKYKKVGFCRKTEELVLDSQILNLPYLKDDMDVYRFNGKHWDYWTPETQVYVYLPDVQVPKLVKMAMVMLE